MQIEAVPRPTGRVLVTNGNGRLLLFHCRTSPDRPNDLCWITPGGGVRAGETAAVAAARELNEETGISVSPDQLGRVIAYSSGEWTAGSTVYVGHDSFFWLQVDDPVIDSRGQEALERTLIIGHAWWDETELDSTEELVFPIGVAGLLRDMLAERLPSVPVRLPWRADD